MATRSKDIVDAERFGTACSHSGLSDVEIAKATGGRVHVKSISHYRNGRGNPVPSSRVLLAEALHVSEDWLLGRSEDGGPRDYRSTGGGAAPVTVEDMDRLEQLLTKIFSKDTPEETKRTCRELCLFFVETHDRLEEIRAKARVALPPAKK